MKRFLLSCVSIIIIFSSLFLSSCYKETAIPPITETQKNEQPASNHYHEKLNILPDSNFEGAKFRIATDSSSLFIPQNQTSVVGKEQYLRNKAVEEKYNIKITLTDESGLPTIADRIRSEALAGADYCDMVLLESAGFKTLVSSDALINVRSIPYLDLGESYYHENALTSTNFGNFTYGISGSFNYDPENVYVVFYNKDLLAKTALPSLHQLALDNQWDFENFLIYSEEVSTVCRAEGINVYGFSSTQDQQTLINAFWAASGQSFLSNPYGEKPQLIYNNNDTLQNFITQTQNILFRSPSYLKDQSLALQSFQKQECFSMIAPLKFAEEITGYGINWGIVPLPKLDINQKEYYSYLDSSQTYVGFSKGTPDTALSGMVTEALFCASDGLSELLTLKAYLNLYLNSSDDALQIQSAISKPYYDAVEFFSFDSSPYAASTQILLYRVLSSEGNFDSLYNQYLKMFQKYVDGKIKT